MLFTFIDNYILYNIYISTFVDSSKSFNTLISHFVDNNVLSTFAISTFDDRHILLNFAIYTFVDSRKSLRVGRLGNRSATRMERASIARSMHYAWLVAKMHESSLCSPEQNVFQPLFCKTSHFYPILSFRQT